MYNPKVVSQTNDYNRRPYSIYTFFWTIICNDGPHLSFHLLQVLLQKPESFFQTNRGCAQVWEAMMNHFAHSLTGKKGVCVVHQLHIHVGVARQEQFNICTRAPFFVRPQWLIMANRRASDSSWRAQQWDCILSSKIVYEFKYRYFYKH